MGSDPDGGYLVPEDFKADLLKVASEDGIIRPFATVLPAGSSPDTAVNIPVLNQAGAAEKGLFSLEYGLPGVKKERIKPIRKFLLIV